MSDEKLTVAELLARRNKERGDSAGSEDRPRRRRRSLEEGGVSVAELTGSIPRVEADGPRRGSHAVVEDDELDDEQVVESAEAADSTEAVEPVEPVEAAEPVESAEQYDEDGSAEAEYADELAASEEFEDEPVTEDAEDAADAVDPVDYAEPAETTDSAEWVGEYDEEGSAEAEYADELAAAEEFGDEPIADEPVADEAIGDETVDEELAEPREPFSVPSAVPVDPRPVMANDETGEITFTFTKFHDARTASEPVAEVGPMGREVLEGSMAYDDRPTNIIPVVDEDPADPFDAPDDVDDRSRDDRAFDGSAIAGGAIGAASAGAMADHVDDVPAAYREREGREHEDDVHEHAVGPDAFDDEDDHRYGAIDREDAEATAAFDGSSLIDDREPLRDEEPRRDFVDFSGGDRSSEDRVDPYAAPFDEPAAAAPAVAVGEADKADKATKKSRDDYAEDNSLSIGLLIAQTIVGLLFGGLVFALFMMLWMVLPTAVVAVIAVAFAFGLVVVVNLIRRERDRLTPILAGIVGLVVSFAPYVLTMM